MWNYLGGSGALKNPLRLFCRLHAQNIMMIQPADLYMDGGMNMCDGCPDITIHEGKLVWSLPFGRTL